MESRRSAEHNTITVVTGANNGIGFETAKVLAERGHTVIMACRDLSKAAAAKADILTCFPNAKLTVMQLDLADLDSVRRFCDAFSTTYPRLDLLINNAGILNVPNEKTKQGLEIIMGTNFFGTFALTAGLYPSLLKANGTARIVTVGSNVHRDGIVDFANFHGEKNDYTILQRYANSKLAGMLFAFRMDRLFKEKNIPIISIAVHPGACAMNSTPSEKADISNLLLRCGLFISNNTIAMTPAEGGQNVVTAATKPELTGGEYLSPQSWWLGEMRGKLSLTQASPKAYDEEVAATLWSHAERLTNTTFTILPREDNTLTCASAAARMI